MEVGSEYVRMLLLLNLQLLQVLDLPYAAR
jgi:hypothetical protein